MRVSKRRGGNEGFGLEAMEGRQLLTADLAVAWDTANFQIPAVLVPGDRFDPNGGTNRVEAPIQVVDVGTTAASGTVRIDFYLSLNTSLSITGQDILMRSYTGEPLSLDVYTGDPNQIGTFSPDMFVPADTAPGTYFLKVRLVPDSNIGDFNASNNIAASTDGIVVDRKFGTFNGRTNVVMALKDADGTTITFNATGGGYGTVTPSPDGFGVTLNSTGNLTAVSLLAGGGDGKFDLTFVTINGSVGSFSAPDGRLRGALTATTGFGAMTFGDVLGPTTITVPATSQVPSFTLGNVSELSIDSAVGIDAISVTSWYDTAGPADFIRAPWLGALTSTNNFYANIRLAGRGAGQTTLGPVNITGVIKRGAWSINGVGSSLSIFATTVYWSASFAGSVTSLSTGGSFRGMFTASSIGSITSGRDILLSGILAGAYLGDDGVLGGTGSNADTFGAGTIGTIDVFHNIAGVTIAAGLDPTDGVFRNGNDAIVGGTASSIGRITVGNLIGAVARVITNVYSGPITVHGVAQDWRFNQRYSLSTTGPSATLGSASVSDVGGAPTASISVRFNSTGLIDRNTIGDGAIRISGPGGFLAFGVLVTKPFDGPTNQRAAFGNFTVRLANVGDPAMPGTYTISVVGNSVADARGNFAPAVVVGTFDVM
jgi:hypothetical protein